MIYEATKAIEAAMQQKDIKCTVNETESSSLVRVGWSQDGFSVSLLIRFNTLCSPLLTILNP